MFFVRTIFVAVVAYALGCVYTWKATQAACETFGRIGDKMLESLRDGDTTGEIGQECVDLLGHMFAFTIEPLMLAGFGAVVGALYATTKEANGR